MTKVEKKEKINIMTAAQAINRHARGEVKNGATVVELPFIMNTGDNLRIYFVKNEKGKKLVLISPLSLLTSLPASLAVINDLVKEYGVFLSEIPEGDYSLAETSDEGLSQRIRNMMQAIITVDGIIRIRKTLNERVIPRTPKEASPTSTATGASKQKERTSRSKQPASTSN